MGCDKPFSLQDHTTHLSLHAEERMAQRNVSQEDVQKCLEEGECFWDPKNNTIALVLRDYYDSAGQDLLVGINSEDGKISTVMRGDRIISSRLISVSIV